jgi:hypothetical protein
MEDVIHPDDLLPMPLVNPAINGSVELNNLEENMPFQDMMLNSDNSS